jgi:DNA-binding transcriptional MerR regulator/uncharacterized protein (DUF433 family)
MKDFFGEIGCVAWTILAMYDEEKSPIGRIDPAFGCEVRAMTTATHKNSRLGVGLYSIADAARIVGAHPGRIRQWCRESQGLIPGTLRRDDGLITFQELMELHFIKMFRDEGVSLETIRRASNRAASRYHSDCPFSVKRFDTDGTDIFATLQKESSKKLIVEDIARGQLVFEKVLRPFFRKLEYGSDFDLLRYWPLSKTGRVVLDPKRKFGKPIDSETGIPTHVIADALKAGSGQSPAVVARWLGIPLAAVKKAAQFERSLSA